MKQIEKKVNDHLASYIGGMTAINGEQPLKTIRESKNYKQL